MILTLTESMALSTKLAARVVQQAAEIRALREQIARAGASADALREAHGGEVWRRKAQELSDRPYAGQTFNKTVPIPVPVLGLYAEAQAREATGSTGPMFAAVKPLPTLASLEERVYRLEKWRNHVIVNGIHTKSP